MNVAIDESELDINTYTILLRVICTLVKSDRLMLPTMESVHNEVLCMYRYVQVCTGVYKCVHTGVTVYCMNEY